MATATATSPPPEAAALSVPFHRTLAGQVRHPQRTAPLAKPSRKPSSMRAKLPLTKI